MNHSVWGESGVVIDGESLIPAYVQAAYLMRGAIIARQLPVGSLPADRGVATGPLGHQPGHGAEGVCGA